MQKSALYFAFLFFTIAAITQIVRLATGFSIVVDGTAIPLAMSYVIEPITVMLAIWMWVAARHA
ncbi:MAG: hypothetical protein LJE67_08480 [Salaquimonas sp.]|jgi:hypothetical protein|nr:hypothetical protein [Salaquimonas sp.]